MAGGIKLKLTGFDKLLEKVQEASKDASRAAAKVVDESSKVIEAELKNEASASGLPTSLTGEITREVTAEGDRYSASTGWKLGNYDPRNLSAGYKAIFLNYGTVRRQTKTGKDRGQLEKRDFINRAKKAAKPKVKKLQKQIIDEVMGDLK